MTKEKNKIAMKKSNAKQSLDMAFGFSNNGREANMKLNENGEQNNKINSQDDLELSDLSSE